MNVQSDLSPVSLSYVGALRGVKPRRPGENFTYAVVNCRDPELLVCLAASNPDGRFYGVTAEAAGKARGEQLARDRQVANVTFLAHRPGEILAAAEKGASPLPSLNYLCCDERAAALEPAERAALFALAGKLLLPGGLFCTGYRAYGDDEGALRFLVREFAPEMDAGQAKEFLQELKQLGTLYFSGHPALAAKLDQAIAKGEPDQFFAACGLGAAPSRSFDTIVALRPRGFVYVGDADIGMNYVELAAPSSAHQLIIDCRNNLLYEQIKDFALDRRTRLDVWCRQPASATADPAELFGNFTYGITMTRDEVPAEVKTQAKPVDLSAPLFQKLIDLLTLIPAGIGDFLEHPNGRGFTPSEALGAVQILVACGIARPMRGRYETEGRADIAQPRLVGTFNQYLDKTSVTGADILLASPVAGRAIAVPPRDALVMQALNRVGLADSVSALLPELERLAQNPGAAARIMDAAEPTPEIAHHMIEDVVMQSIVRWYAYGLLKAA